jgi:hypothetical protein
MKRAVLSGVLASLAFAASARAAAPATIPLRYDLDVTEVALSGPDVLVMEESFNHSTRVLAIPRTGGKPRTLLRVRGAQWGSGQLAASARRVAVTVDAKREHRVYTGPPSGPLKLVRHTPDPHDETWTPGFLDVDGARMLLVEFVPEATDGDDEHDEDAGQVRAAIYDASGWTPIPWTSSERVPVAIAGPYAATVAFHPKRVELVDFAGGTPLYTLNGSFEGTSLDLLADGRIAAQMQSGLRLGAVGKPQATVHNSRRLLSPHFAGSSIAMLDDAHHTLDLVGATGKQTTVGPPSFGENSLTADRHGVAWAFNGCVRYAAFSTAPKAAGDPCPQSEIVLYSVGAHAKLHGNRARVPMKCVAAASGRCRGELLLREQGAHKPVLGRGTFAVRPSAHDHQVTVHFTAAAVAKFHREHGGYLIVYPHVRDGVASGGADGDYEFDVEVD